MYGARDTLALPYNSLILNLDLRWRSTNHLPLPELPRHPSFEPPRATVAEKAEMYVHMFTYQRRCQIASYAVFFVVGVV